MPVINQTRLQIGLPQFPDGVPAELQQPFLQVFNAIHNLSRFLSQFAGVDPQPEDYWNQLTLDDTLFAQNMNRVYLKCNEDIPFGAIVSPIAVGAELQMRLANATNNTRWAAGICSTVGGKLTGQFAEFMLGCGLVSGISGMVLGARYWLHTTNGQIVNVAPVAAGNIEQFLGWAISSNRLLMNISGNYIQH